MDQILIVFVPGYLILMGAISWEAYTNSRLSFTNFFFRERWRLIFLLWVLPTMLALSYLILKVYPLVFDYFSAEGALVFPPFLVTVPLSPLLLMLWYIRDQNKEYDQKQKKRDQEQKDIELQQANFHQLQEWAGVVSEAGDNTALRVSAIHQLKPFLRGENGQEFSIPTMELVAAILHVILANEKERSNAGNDKKSNDGLIKNALGILANNLPNVIPVTEKERNITNNGEKSENKDDEEKRWARLQEDPKDGLIRSACAYLWKKKLPDSVKEKLAYAPFARLNLAEADFESANLKGSNFKGAFLINTNFEKANLVMSDFRWADLLSANLKEANLTDTNLAGADLTGADLIKTNLENTRNWREISSIKEANIIGIKNAPEGFREWALQHGAIEKMPEVDSEPPPISPETNA